MALAKITLISLDNWTAGDIWGGLVLPEGINIETAKNEILLQCGQFPLLYPDPDFLKAMISHWSQKWYHNFDRWIKAESEEYEALFNLDVRRVTTNDGSRKRREKFDSKDYTTLDHDNTLIKDYDSSGDSVATEMVSAFDSSTFENSKQVREDHRDYVDDTTTDVGGGHNNREVDNTTKEKEITKNEMIEVFKGNQGTSFSQDMLEKEYNIRKWNIYQHIADVFAAEFCVMIY